MAELASATPPSPLRLHGGLAEVYRRLIVRLEDALGDPLIRDEAMEALRGMVEKVVLTPSDDGALDGKLAEILQLCHAAKTKAGKQKLPSGFPEGRQLLVVAGAGNQLCLLTMAKGLE